MVAKVPLVFNEFIEVPRVNDGEFVSGKGNTPEGIAISESAVYKRSTDAEVYKGRWSLEGAGKCDFIVSRIVFEKQHIIG